MNEPLFPEWEERHPPPRPKQKRKWVPSKDQAKILRAIEQRPAGLSQIHARLNCELLHSTINNHIETLVRHGLLEDTGERGQWTRKGREIIWRLK